MSFKDIVSRINESPWKGMISEVGFGVPLAHNWLNIPGASNTILYANSPYSKSFQGNSDRSVSQDGVEILVNKLHTMCPLSEQNGPMFYLAVSGSHKRYNERGDSHGWAALKTVVPQDNGKDQVTTTVLHFRVSKFNGREEMDRWVAGSYVAGAISWLLKTMLLGDFHSWEHAYEKYGLKGIVDIDIVIDPRLSLEDQLLLTGIDTPMVYHKGSFQRVLDYTRKYDRYMSGSFNPPHQAHLDAGKGAMFIINFENARKDDVSLTDMAHRIRMLDLMGVPVMITRKRPLVALQVHLLRTLGVKDLTFITGSDTFNAICDTKYIPGNDSIFEPLTDEQEKEAREEILTQFLKPLYHDTGTKFEVYKREGHPVVDNQWSKQMIIEVMPPHDSDHSSTKARSGDLSGVSEEVARYIQANNLYSE